MMQNVSLAEFTYMKVGGNADFLEVANTTEDIVNLVKLARTKNIPYYILGGGSNTIFSDKGYRGLVIINRTNRLTINQTEKTITVDSGVPTNLVVNKTTESGLAGLEDFLGIPGSIGGAIYNNSHYLKSLIGDYVHSATLLSQNLEEIIVDKSFFKFGYDYSILHKTHDIVLSVTFSLHSGDAKDLTAKSRVALNRRRSTQPLEMPSSGCMFKNADGQSAGALIDKAGLKGFEVGGAKVSEKHANFIINTGTATTNDIKQLSDMIIEKIKEKNDLTLKREVFFIDEKGQNVSI